MTFNRFVTRSTPPLSLTAPKKVLSLPISLDFILAGSRFYSDFVPQLTVCKMT